MLSVTGHPLLAYNSFTGHWRFGQGLCEVNAFSMTYLGELKMNYLSSLQTKHQTESKMLCPGVLLVEARLSLPCLASEWFYIYSIFLFNLCSTHELYTLMTKLDFFVSLFVYNGNVNSWIKIRSIVWQQRSSNQKWMDVANKQQTQPPQILSYLWVVSLTLLKTS